MESVCETQQPDFKPDETCKNLTKVNSELCQCKHERHLFLSLTSNCSHLNGVASAEANRV